MPEIDVAAFYCFVIFTECEILRSRLPDRCLERKLLGTILLAHEGMNTPIAGIPAAIVAPRDFLGANFEVAKMT